MSELRAVPDEPAGGITSQASRLLAAAYVARATAAARDGRYDAAEALLNDALQAERSVDALDLFARIRAQQGRLVDAELLWSEALNRDASFAAAQNGLRRIRAMQRGRVAWWPFAAAAIVIVAALLFEFRPRPEPMVIVNPPPIRALPPPAQPRAVTLAAIPGIAMRQEKGELVATFEAGVFAHGVTMTDEGRALLSQLGQEIERSAPAAHVIIEGHCDRAPIRGRGAYKDDFALGLARSGAVFRYLQQTTHLPADAFSLRSLGSDAPPFAEGTRSGDTRNRTVVIRIRP